MQRLDDIDTNINKNKNRNDKSKKENPRDNVTSNKYEKYIQ